MTNQEILANGPEGWTHYVPELDDYFKEDGSYYQWYKGRWARVSALAGSVRSRSDIERIVYLESMLKGEVA